MIRFDFLFNVKINVQIQRKKQLVTSHKIKELMGLFLKYKKERLHDLAMEALGSTSGEDYEALKVCIYYHTINTLISA